MFIITLANIQDHEQGYIGEVITKNLDGYLTAILRHYVFPVHSEDPTVLNNNVFTALSCVSFSTLYSVAKRQGNLESSQNIFFMLMTTN